jgi:hypothetical protein
MMRARDAESRHLKPDYLTIADVADELAVSEHVVRQLIRHSGPPRHTQQLWALPDRTRAVRAVDPPAVRRVPPLGGGAPQGRLPWGLEGLAYRSDRTMTVDDPPEDEACAEN